MADQGQEGMSLAEKDKIKIARYNKIMKQGMEREDMLVKHYNWRGNKLPAMNIEPMPYERWRIGGKGMTDAERAARKQWVQDQHLSPNEPRNIPELTPRNPFRRLYAGPWDSFFKMLQPAIGKNAAYNLRLWVPRALMAYVGVVGFVYYVQHNPSSWEQESGWHMKTSKPMILPGHSQYPALPDKAHDDHFDKGFKVRKTLQDYVPTRLE